MTGVPKSYLDPGEVVVWGENISVDRKILQNHESTLDDSMRDIAAQISYWGEVWAASEKELAEAEAHYNHWRAQFSKAIHEADPKAPEWRVKQEIEADPKYVEIKSRLAMAYRNTIVLKAHFEAVRARPPILQSQGANKRAEIKSIGLATKEVEYQDERREEREQETEERIERMRSIFRKRVD